MVTGVPLQADIQKQINCTYSIIKKHLNNQGEYSGKPVKQKDSFWQLENK